MKVLAAHDTLLRSRIDRYRGQVVKTAGDGFMVAFRDAEAACRAAVGIQRDLRPHHATARRGRSGCGSASTPARWSAGTATTSASNVAIAARIGDLASGGEVLASDAVRDALDEDAAVVLDEPGEVELKGLPGTHVIWRVCRRA